MIDVYGCLNQNPAHLCLPKRRGLLPQEPQLWPPQGQRDIWVVPYSIDEEMDDQIVRELPSHHQCGKVGPGPGFLSYRLGSHLCSEWASRHVRGWAGLVPIPHSTQRSWRGSGGPASAG